MWRTPIPDLGENQRDWCVAFEVLGIFATPFEVLLLWKAYQVVQSMMTAAKAARLREVEQPIPENCLSASSREVSLVF